MKRDFLVFLTVAIFCVAAFSAKSPKWINDPKSVYPESKYLARNGEGISNEAARASALAALSGYFKTQVSTNAKSNTKISDKNGEISKERVAEQEILVQTQMDLIAVDYSEIYFDKKEGKYYICAFIDRDIAWSSIEHDVNKCRNKYESLYDKALSEKEDILRHKYLLKSRAAGEELITKLYFGFLINPAKQAEFQQKIDEISNDAIFATLDALSVPLYLNVSGDQGGIAASALNEIFTSLGYTVSAKKSASQKYALNVEINPNEEWSGEGDTKMVAVFPNVEIKLANIVTGEEFYTWLKSYGRVSNFSIEKAMQRVLKNNIVPDIKKFVAEDYRARFWAK